MVSFMSRIALDAQDWATPLLLTYCASKALDFAFAGQFHYHETDRRRVLVSSMCIALCTGLGNTTPAGILYASFSGSCVSLALSPSYLHTIARHPKPTVCF